MSKFITVGEHRISIPEPTSKDDILFYDEKNPVWDRARLFNEYRDIWSEFLPNFTKLDQSATLYDQDGILTHLNQDGSAYIRRIYEQEITRRTYGVHFKNGKDIEFITGDHYNTLMWCKTQRHDGNGDYFDYREFQRDFYYLIHHVWASPQIMGLFLSKAKKTGITNLFWLYYLNRSTMQKNKNFGYMNIEQGVASKTFRDYFLYSYNNMVPALRPSIKNKSENDGTIIFGNRYTNAKKAALMANGSANELNSSVFCVPTQDKAFDVAVMSDIAFDEPTKYKKNFGEIWRTNKEAVKIQSKINGRAWCFNYTPDEDSDSFREARQIFYDSELKTIRQGGSGQTTSGLICYHVPAYASWEGCFDKHGRCDEKRAMAEIQQERDKVKENSRALQAITRQYANNKREAWGSAGAGSVFDNIRLGDLLAEVELDQLNSTDSNYVEGNLEWKNNLWNLQPHLRIKGQFSEVRFIPLTDDEKRVGKTGKFRLYNDVPRTQQNMGLKYGKDEYDCLIPPLRFASMLGFDPTKYAAASEVVQGSKNAGHLFSMPDEGLDSRRGVVASKVLQIVYYERPEMPEEAFTDCLMLMIYSGCLALVEANEPYTATRLLEEGLGRFMLVRDEHGIIRRWERYMGLPKESEKKYQLIRMTANSQAKEMLEALVRVIKKYFTKPKPGSGEKDYGPTFGCDRTLKQLMDFDPQDTKLYDLAMSLGWTLFGIDIYMDILLMDNNDFEDPDNIKSFLDALAA